VDPAVTPGAGVSARIEVRGLAMTSRGETVQSGLDFAVAPGSIFAITGDSGSGKSLLLRHMVGLHQPAAGEVLYDGESFWAGRDADRQRLKRRCGVFFQGAVLVSSMTLLENVAVKLRTNTALRDAEAEEVAALKLAVMGLRGYERYYPSQVTDGVRTRAALARATALDPEILFFDEPTSGLDPLSARRIDDLVLGLRDAMGATVVLASYDLPSLFALADDAVFLDSERKTMIARGRPEELRERSGDPKVRAFLTRGRL
jgi:phospholipid/cholesterol/gamma-HCH transport system ATP-binding protein